MPIKNPYVLVAKAWNNEGEQVRRGILTMMSQEKLLEEMQKMLDCPANKELGVIRVTFEIDLKQ